MKRAQWPKLLGSSNDSGSLRLTPHEELLDVQRNPRNFSLPVINSPEISFNPGASNIRNDIVERDIYFLLVHDSKASRFSILDGLVLCGTNNSDQFERIGVFHAVGPRACAALKYKLLPFRTHDNTTLHN